MYLCFPKEQGCSSEIDTGDIPVLPQSGRTVLRTRAGRPLISVLPSGNMAAQ